MTLTIARPTKLTDVPALAPKREKLNQLQATEARLKADLADVENRMKQNQGTDREYAVQAVLAGQDYQRPLHGKQELTAERDRLREDLGIVQAAINAQQQVVSSARMEESREACKASEARPPSSPPQGGAESHCSDRRFDRCAAHPRRSGSARHLHEFAPGCPLRRHW